MGLAVAQRLGVPEIVGRLLAARGVSADAAADFLEPTLRALLPDPSVLTDMDAAAARWPLVGLPAQVPWAARAAGAVFPPRAHSRDALTPRRLRVLQT